MKRAEFLNLPKDAQASWVTHSFPDYQMRAYEDSCFFGMFYKVRDDQINSYISDREYFETLDILRGVLPEFSEQDAMMGLPPRGFFEDTPENGVVLFGHIFKDTGFSI